jgi:LmbE family N-acetylglucosaminyl deacetylase
MHDGAPARALVIMAHPDDADYFAAGTVALWSTAGCTVTYVVVTSGDKGNAAGAISGAQLAALRQAEQRAAAAVVGVENVVFLEWPDATVMDGEDLRRSLVAEVRRWRPEIVLSLDPTCYYLSGRINHPDHRGVGEAVLAALFPASNNALCFPELLEQGLHPHTVRQLWLTATNAPDHWVDITAEFDRKVAALACNVSQLRPHDDVRAQLHAAFGVKDAEGRTVYREGFRVLALD